MSNLIIAAKQAVEAMKFELKIDWTDPDESLLAADKLREAIVSLEKVIAEAEKHEVSQEPVQVTIKDFVKAVEGKEDIVGRPVYWAQWPNADTHPQPKREWVGLTDEDDIDWKEGGNLKDLVQAVEAKLKEKNSD